MLLSDNALTNRSLSYSHKKAMIGKDTNETLLGVVATLAQPRWHEYAAYCRARESGLRHAAFKHLSVFVRSIKLASLEEQRTLVNWICERLLEAGPDGTPLAPEPLLTQFVLPALNEWATQEPQSAIPIRWHGVLISRQGYAGMRCGLHAPDQKAQELLRQALRLDPQDQIARVRLAECLIGILDFHAHHLPEAYLGEPEADLHIVEEAEALIADLLDPKQTTRLRGELQNARQLLEDWIDSLAAKVDFAAWRFRQGRPVSSINRVYVYDPKKKSESVHFLVSTSSRRE